MTETQDWESEQEEIMHKVRFGLFALMLIMGLVVAGCAPAAAPAAVPAAESSQPAAAPAADQTIVVALTGAPPRSTRPTTAAASRKR
jgi:ABC-type transport system substrate-binding protein